jgi:hypothetical protein
MMPRARIQHSRDRDDGELVKRSGQSEGEYDIRVAAHHFVQVEPSRWAAFECGCGGGEIFGRRVSDERDRLVKIVPSFESGRAKLSPECPPKR